MEPASVTIGFLTEMATTLDAFLKKLHYCGFISIYSVVLKGSVIDKLSKEEFGLAVNKFICNLQCLLSRLSVSGNYDSESVDTKEDIVPLLELMNDELKATDNVLDLGMQQHYYNNIDEDKYVIDSDKSSAINYIDDLLSQVDCKHSMDCEATKVNKLLDIPTITISSSQNISDVLSTIPNIQEANRRIKSDITLENSKINEAMMAISTQEGRWHCDLCNQKFKVMSHLQDHCRIYHDMGCFECNICSMRLKRKLTLKRHIKRHLQKNDVTGSEVSQIYSMMNQSKLDSSEEQEVKEVITKYCNKNNGWNCNMCTETFPSMCRLQDHCRIQHEGRGCFECNICGLRVMTKLSLKRHIKRHFHKNEGTCSICGQTFTRLDNLANHYKLHVGKPLHRCKDCSKGFPSSLQLSIHKEVHINKQRYTCHQCNKTFSRKDKLKDHTMRHLKIKRFQCSICDKSYVEKRDLCIHLKKVHGEIYLVPSSSHSQVIWIPETILLPN